MNDYSQNRAAVIAKVGPLLENLAKDHHLKNQLTSIVCSQVETLRLKNVFPIVILEDQHDHRFHYHISPPSISEGYLEN